MQAVIPQFESSVAVVIPCYKVRSHVLGVIAAIGPEVTRIYAVDDACPDQSGTLIEEECSDPRVTVLRHQEPAIWPNLRRSDTRWHKDAD